MTENLKYKGKDYPVRTSYYALKHTSKELKKEKGKELKMEDLFQQEMDVYEPLLFYSLVAGHKAEDKELDLKREDMEFMLDECMWDFVEVLTNFFPKAKKGEGKAGAGKQKNRLTSTKLQE